MHEHGEPDGRVVPVIPSNEPGRPGEEAAEGRRSAKGNTASETRPGRSAGSGVSSELDRVRQVERKDRDVRFTALLHHVTVERLEAAYRAIRPGAAPGVDGVTWQRNLTPGSMGAGGKQWQAAPPRDTSRLSPTRPDPVVHPRALGFCSEPIRGSWVATLSGPGAPID